MKEMQLMPTSRLAAGVSFVLIMLHLGESDPLVAALGEPVTLQCEGHGMALNELNIQWRTPDQVVASFSEGIFYSHPAFRNRVHFPNNLEGGNFALIINHTFYSDYDTYECYQDKSLLKQWILNIIGTKVRVSVGSTAVLPCYSHVDRQLNSDDFIVQWKKGDMMALNFDQGKMDRDLEYSLRTAVNVEAIPEGDFSLSITDTKTSDSGVYQCLDKTHGILSSINLDVYEENMLKFHRYSGDSLTFPLPLLDIQIEFVNSDSQHQWLCSIFVDYAKCREDSYSRFKYKNGLFSMEHLSENDEGRYIMMTGDGYREIKVVYLEVLSSPPLLFYTFWTILCVILLVLLYKIKIFKNHTGRSSKKHRFHSTRLNNISNIHMDHRWFDHRQWSQSLDSN